MVKASAFIFIIVLFIFFYTTSNFASPLKKTKINQRNNPPIIKIISPANNTAFANGQPVHYSITVSDKEDGESKYDEINPKEILLEVKYNSEASTQIEALKKTVQTDAPGLAAMRMSNCFNCHGFDNKVIGPAFIDINKRYKPTVPNIILLAKRIREGSTGIWGKVTMPTHPELTQEQIQNMVKWIMQNALGTTVHYYIGTEGSFSLKLPDGAGKSSTYILTASYTDHGINNIGQRLKGQDAIVIHIQ